MSLSFVVASAVAALVVAAAGALVVAFFADCDALVPVKFAAFECPGALLFVTAVAFRELPGRAGLVVASQAPGLRLASRSSGHLAPPGRPRPCLPAPVGAPPTLPPPPN